MAICSKVAGGKIIYGSGPVSIKFNLLFLEFEGIGTNSKGPGLLNKLAGIEGTCTSKIDDAENLGQR